MTALRGDFISGCMFDDGYISLENLSASLSLPQGYLKQLAADRKIPFLLIGSRMRFNMKDVQEALGKLASNDFQDAELKGQSGGQ